MAVAMADLLKVLAGGVLLYTGITDDSGNPKHLLQSLLQGKTPARASASSSLPSSGGTTSGSPATATPAAGGSLQTYAQKLLTSYGWSNQWPAFNALENAEAGWNPHARNPSSGAYGLAQALGHCTAATRGSDACEYGGYISDADNKAANSGDGYAQLRWMMAYIKSRYGSPAAAWSGYHTRGGWY